MDHLLTMTLTSTPDGNLIAVTVLTCSLVQSRSIYLLKMVISKLSQVFDPELKINVTLSARSSSTADSEIFIGHSDWTSDSNSLVFRVSNDFVGDLFNTGEFGATDCDSEFLVGEFNFFSFLFIV
jgi:hypothetical protein